MASLERPKLEGRGLRRLLITFIVLPPIASVIASAVGAWDVQASLAIMVGAVLTLLSVLLDVTLEGRAESRQDAHGYRNDDEALADLVQFTVDQRPREVDLLEYSAYGALPFLNKLSEISCTKRIRLLVAHPDAAISDYQRDIRLAEALRALAYRIPLDQVAAIGLQIKCYKESASLRGRLVGRRFIAVGWYSFDDRGLADPGGRPLAGGSNASIGASVDSPIGSRLLETYSRTFENMWRDAAEAYEAWEPYRAQLPHLPASVWLKAVRGHD
jgi:hypothetical protein